MPLVQGIVAALVAVTLTGAAGPSQAGAPAVEPLPVLYKGPPAPHCGALAARHGTERLWFGAISGIFIDDFFDWKYPYYAEGCFQTEHACRRWLHENLTFMNGGNLNWMRCQPGIPGRALY